MIKVKGRENTQVQAIAPYPEAPKKVALCSLL